MTTRVPMVLPTNFTDGSASTPPAMTVTYNSSNQSPGYSISISGLNGSGGSTVVVVRHDLDNQLADAPVRGLDTIPIGGDTLAATDYEMPWQYRFSYVMSVISDTGTTLYTVTAAGPYSLTTAASVPALKWPYNGGFLRDPNNPALTQPLWVDIAPTTVLTPTAAKSRVIGRQNSIYTLDVLSGRSGQFSFIIDGSQPYGTDILTVGEYRTLLRGGPVFLLQNTFQPDTFPDLWFTITGPVAFEPTGVLTNVSRPSGYPKGEQGQMIMRVVVPFDEVDRPLTVGTGSVSVTTWQSIVNHYSTWQTQLNANATWQATLNSAA